MLKGRLPILEDAGLLMFHWHIINVERISLHIAASCALSNGKLFENPFAINGLRQYTMLCTVIIISPNPTVLRILTKNTLLPFDQSPEETLPPLQSHAFSTKSGTDSIFALQHSHRASVSVLDSVFHSLGGTSPRRNGRKRSGVSHLLK